MGDERYVCVVIVVVIWTCVDIMWRKLVHIHAHTDIYRDINMDRHIYVCICIYLSYMACIVCIHIHMDVNVHVYTCAYIYVYVYINMNAHISCHYQLSMQYISIARDC